MPAWIKLNFFRTKTASPTDKTVTGETDNVGQNRQNTGVNPSASPINADTPKKRVFSPFNAPGSVYRKAIEFEKSRTKNGFEEFLAGDFKWIKSKVDRLTPKEKAMLNVVHYLCHQSRFRPISRDQIASALKKKYLTRYDIEVLDKLVNQSFMKRSKQPMPTYTDEFGRLMPRGSRVIYTMPVDTGYRLFFIMSWSRRKYADYDDRDDDYYMWREIDKQIAWINKL